MGAAPLTPARARRRTRRRRLLLSGILAAGCGALSAGLTPVDASSHIPLPPEVSEATVEIEPTQRPRDAMAIEQIGLGEALDRALSENVDFSLARAEEHIIRWRGRAEQGRLLPALEFGIGGRNRVGRIQGSFGVLRDTTYDTYEQRLAAVYRINIGEQIHRSIASRREIGAAVLMTLGAEQRLLLRVTELYQGLVLARIGVQIAEQLVEDSEEFVRIASARATSGIGLGSEVARAEAKLATDRQQLVEVRRLWERASVDLAEVLRLDLRVLLEPTEKELRPLDLAWPVDTWDPKESARIRPDVQAARRHHGAAMQNSLAAWWDLLGPDIEARWNEIKIGADRDDLEDRTDKEIFLAWTISLEELGQVKRSRAEKESARLKLVRTEEKALAEVANARHEIRAAREQIPLARDGLEAARTNLSISLARYEAGTAIALEILDAEDTLAQARLNLARSIVAFNLAQTRLLAVSGVIERRLFGGRSLTPGPK